MKNTNARFTEASDESIETTREVLKASLASIERLTKINLDASKKFLEETTQALQEMASITNPKELFEKVNQLATSTVENNMSSCRNVCGIITETGSKISKMVESRIQNAQKNMANTTENFSKINPIYKSNFGVDAMQNWISSTIQAMEALDKMAAGISEFANNNIKSAANATSKTAKKTATR